MTTRRSSRKKPNRFQDLSEAVDENKESDFIDSSSVTIDYDQSAAPEIS